MAIRITTPSEGFTTVKDVLVSILVHKKGLSAVELHKEIKVQYRKEVSYQAVHAGLLGLVGEGVLVVEGKKYFLSKEFVHTIHRLSKSLEQTYTFK